VNLGNNISASVTFSGPLAANTSYTTSDILAWTISDGDTTFSSTANYLTSQRGPAVFQTDALGEIVSWSLWAQLSDTQTFPHLVTQNFVGLPSFFDFDMSSTDTYGASVETVSGWSGPMAAIPEPSTLTLLSLASIVLIGCGWRHARG
jgi:hypothetical protein